MDSDTFPWPTGRWSPIHAVLIPDGRVLTYGTNRDGAQTGRFNYDVWDPGSRAGGGHLTLPNSTSTDPFCSAQSRRRQRRRRAARRRRQLDRQRTSNRGNPDDTLILFSTAIPTG